MKLIYKDTMKKINENPTVWMFKIENSDSEDLQSLMNEEEYLSTIEK